MLHPRFTSILNVKSVDEFKSHVVRFVNGLEFETYSAMTVVDCGPSGSQFTTVSNPPPGYRKAFSSVEGGKIDPVMQHCRTRGVPIVWNQATYVAAGVSHKWEQQAEHGYRCGIAYAMHLPAGLHFLLGVNRDQDLPKCAEQVSRMTADLQLFAVHAQEAAVRLMVPPARQDLLCLDQLSVKPTARELECLRWTMEGKTAWEVGRILGISEQTAARHVNNASRKLDCVNKHQAVLKALRLGLIR
jgi:DNA-binding CsgD family transcriptional regulator